MAEVSHGVLVAVGVQTDSTTINGDIRDLHDATSVASSDGIVLGHAGSGDDETGVTLPEFVKVFQENPDVAGSFTKSASTFDRVDAEGMSIAFVLKGNGATSTPGADEALPLAGIDALLRGAGLQSALSDSNSDYSYNSEAGTTYLSVRVWAGGQTWLLKGCVVESLTMALVGGESTVCTCNISVGALADDTSDGAGSDPEVRAIPTTITYGTQSTLTPPQSKGVTFTWGASRCYGELSVEIANSVSTITDSCQTSGVRLVQDSRAFNVSGTIWQDTAVGADFEWNQLVDGAVNADMIGQIGTAAGATPGATLNAYKFTLNDVDIRSVSYEKAGAYSRAVLAGVCTSTTASTEFTLTFN